MAQNITLTNGVAAHPTKAMETCNRPLLIQYTGAGSPASTLVQIQVEVLEKVNGSWLYIKKGSSLIQGRDSSSPEATPIFTFDISSILKSGISRDVDFELFNTANGANGISRTGNSPISATYNVKAISWYVDELTGVLTLNDTDPSVDTVTDSLFFCDIDVPDREVLGGVYSNMLAASPFLSTWVLDNALSTSGSFSSNMKPLTNCPSGYRRVIPSNYPLSLSVLANNSNSAVTIECSGKDDNNASFNLPLLTGDFVVAAEVDITSVNLTVNDSKLFNLLTDCSLAGISSGDISIYLKYSTYPSRTWDFEIVDKGASTNSVFRKAPKSETIYFVNDYNVLDFFTFESHLGVAHTHSKSSFKSGYKDYTRRDSNKFGVSRGKTEEVLTLNAVVNREVSEWLSELYRSTNVFIYEMGADNVGRFCPIRIIDGDTIPLPQDRNNLEQFSISFIKDTYIVNR